MSRRIVKVEISSNWVDILRKYASGIPIPMPPPMARLLEIICATKGDLELTISEKGGANDL